jgi:hypothetical protein
MKLEVGKKRCESSRRWAAFADSSFYATDYNAVAAEHGDHRYARCALVAVVLYAQACYR